MIPNGTSAPTVDALDELIGLLDELEQVIAAVRALATKRQQQCNGKETGDA